MQHETALARTRRPFGRTQVDFTGIWTNELGSTMTLAENGIVLTGQYTSQVSGGGGTVTGPLVGWVDGQIISFTVNWPQPSITAWVGHVIVGQDGTETLQTLRHLATTIANPNDPTELWDSVLAGADSFVRQATPAAGARSGVDSGVG